MDDKGCINDKYILEEFICFEAPCEVCGKRPVRVKRSIVHDNGKKYEDPLNQTKYFCNHREYAGRMPTLSQHKRTEKYTRIDVLDLREWLDWNSLEQGLGSPDIYLMPEPNYAPGQHARLYEDVDVVIHVERWGYKGDPMRHRFLERITKIEICRKHDQT